MTDDIREQIASALVEAAPDSRTSELTDFFEWFGTDLPARIEKALRAAAVGAGRNWMSSDQYNHTLTEAVAAGVAALKEQDDG